MYTINIIIYTCYMVKKYRTAWFILQPIIMLCRKIVSIKDSRVLVRGLENRKDYTIYTIYYILMT